MDQALEPVLTLLATVGLTWGLMPLAVRIGLVDRPGGRKQHDGEIPLVGGLAMFGAFLFALLTFHPLDSSLYALRVGAVVLVGVGLIDDRVGLSFRLRFVAQIAAVLITCSGGTVIVGLGDLLFLGDVTLGYAALPFTVFAVVGVINAMNMADGMDGLAGGLALVSVLALAVIVWPTALDFEFDLLVILACILVGFLSLNARTPWRSRAKIFMGDAGSMFLGLVLAWLLIHLSQGSHAVMASTTALWVFALPLLDTVSVMLRRLLNGRSPFAADRQHLHHLLLLAGFSVPQAVLIMVGLAALLAAIGVVGERAQVAEGVMFGGFALLFALYCWAMSRTWTVMQAPRGVHEGGEPAPRVDG